MLPNLTKKRSVQFQTSSELEPASVSIRRNKLSELKSIDAVRISRPEKGSKARYVIEVFMEPPPCRMTTNTNSTTSSVESAELQEDASLQTPVARTYKELYEFVDLRDKVYNSIVLAHSTQYCKFCLGVLDAVVNGVDPGGVFFTLLGKERMLRKLTKFTEDVLARTVANASTNTEGCCSAHTMVPEAVHAFLFPPSASQPSRAA